MTRYGRRETQADEGGEVISDDGEPSFFVLGSTVHLTSPLTDAERDAPATIVDGVHRLQLDSSFEVQRAMNGRR